MTADELFEKAALNWRNNKGVGTALVPAPLNSKVLVYQILSKLYNKSPTSTAVIITRDFSERTALIEFLTHQEDEENNNEFKRLIDNKNIRVFTATFIVAGNWRTSVDLGIWYEPKNYEFAVASYIDRCKFKLVILNKLFDKQQDNTCLYSFSPILDCFKQAEIDELRVSSPVEEMWVDVTIDTNSKDWQLYEYYCRYIETSLNIFGSFDIMQQARIGNTTLNISAATICSQIAEENGWNEHLDMSYEFNQRIDELYNPNNLRDRATQTYEVIRNRNVLVNDYKGKLEKILEVVLSNPKDKILIISKRGEFASKITEYLNEHSGDEICGNYHNKVDDIPAVDELGNPVFFKSGSEKGKRKSMGYKAQMTLNERKFNLNKLRCLSLSNAPDKSLSVDVSLIIITSPACEDIKSYLYRLSNIRIIGGNIKLFSIFCRNTIEQQKLLNKPVNESHIIVNKDEIVADVGNKSDFLIVD